MPDTTTTNYALTKPQDGASNDTWGPKLHANLDTIDTTMKAISDVADAALPKAGGALTGRVDAKTGTLAKSAITTGSGAKDLNMANAQYFTFTPTGNTTFTFSNVPAPADSAFGFILRLTNGGAFTMTWPASVKWANGLAPALTVAGTDVIVMLTDDAGVTFRAAIAIKDAH